MSQYITPPPNLPMFLYRRPSALKNLIYWARKEHSDRMMYCINHGYWKEFKRLNEDYSPMRVLAEMKNFRKICTTLTQGSWDQLTGRERVFIRRAFELGGLLR